MTAIKIVQDFVPVGRRNRPGYAMTPKYITIHNTANPDATAKNHADYIKSKACEERLAGWHFSVDYTDTIYQHLPLNENGWHAEDGVNGTGNRKSIAIEICEFTDPVKQHKAEENAAWLTAKLIRETPSLLPFPECMRQHWHWSGKDCPRVLRARPGGWEGFLGQVKKFLGEGEDEMLKVAIVVNTLADVLTVEPLARKLDAPIFLREACGQLSAETVIVAGGDATAFKKPGVKVVDLSGENRWKTAEKVGAYYESLK